MIGHARYKDKEESRMTPELLICPAEWAVVKFSVLGENGKGQGLERGRV